MPSKPVYGKDVLLLFLVNAIYQQAACATDCSLSVDTEIVEVTTKTNIPGEGTWRKVQGTKNSWSGAVNGVEFLDRTIVKFADIRELQTRLMPVFIMFTEVDSSGTEYSNWYGLGVITNTTNTAGSEGFATFSITIEGNGVLRSDFTPTNINQPVEMFCYYEATGTEGSSFVIPELQGFVINGRIYRDGLEQSASGTQRLNRTASDVPKPGQFKWDSNTGTLTLAATDPTPSADERIDIPYTIAYSGCSLFIDNFRVSLDSNNHFFFAWQGTGLPENQLRMEYSTDFGVTYNPLAVTYDALNLDNATYNTTLDTDGSYIFRLTPVCTNNQSGKPASAYWKATAARIINHRTDGAVISYLQFTDGVSSNVSAIATDGSGAQLSLVTFTATPYNTYPDALTVLISPNAYPGTVTVKDKNGNTIGTANTTYAQPSLAIVVLANGVPNEFTVILD